jgi:hypothetical protein
LSDGVFAADEFLAHDGVIPDFRVVGWYG